MGVIPMSIEPTIKAVYDFVQAAVSEMSGN